MRALNYFIIVSSIIAGLKSPASAQSVEVHNFYFAKSPKENKTKTEVEVKETKDYKTWELIAGVGTLDGRIKDEFGYITFANGEQHAALLQAKYTQNIFKLGAKRYYNKYFDVHGNLIVPNGQADISADPDSTNGVVPDPGQRVETFAALLEVGGGVTPLHFKILGHPMLEVGADASILLGESDHLGGDSALLMLGARAGLTFTEEFVLTFKWQEEVASERRFRNTTAMLGYRW